MTGSSRVVVECAGSWALVAAGARSERPGGPPVRSDHGKRIAILLPMKPTRAGLIRTWPRLARSDTIGPERKYTNQYATQDLYTASALPSAGT
jgi:hypothetical protein